MLVLTVLAFCLASCGGGTAAEEPLISGTVTGAYAGADFTLVDGYATYLDGNPLIALGTDIHCGSETGKNPPPGYSAGIAVPGSDFAVGSFGSVLVELYKNVGGFSGTGSNNGDLTIDAVTTTTVSGQITYSYTDTSGLNYTLTGTFEVVRCP